MRTKGAGGGSLRAPSPLVGEGRGGGSRQPLEVWALQPFRSRAARPPSLILPHKGEETLRVDPRPCSRGTLSGLGGRRCERVPSPARVRSRARRRLCDHGAGAGDDLPGDAARELRAGRDGDVLDLFRLEADRSRLAVLARLRAHGRRVLPRRSRDRAGGRPAVRQGAGARLRHRVHRPRADLQRARRLALRLFRHRLPDPVRRAPVVRTALHVGARVRARCW